MSPLQGLQGLTKYVLRKRRHSSSERDIGAMEWATVEFVFFRTQVTLESNGSIQSLKSTCQQALKDRTKE